jgi:hypothetical protein
MNTQERQEYYATLNGARHSDVIRKAFAGEATAKQAISAYCLMCKRKSVLEIKSCADVVCPLRAFRPFRSKEAAHENPSEKS